VSPDEDVLVGPVLVLLVTISPPSSMLVEVSFPLVPSCGKVMLIDSSPVDDVGNSVMVVGIVTTVELLSVVALPLVRLSDGVMFVVFGKVVLVNGGSTTLVVVLVGGKVLL
jgi:hypothetical protein